MKTQIKKSKIHGNGIFAKENITKGEIIEVCPVIVLPKKDLTLIDDTSLYDYYFEWKNDGGAITLGKGSLYNHSYNPNAKYTRKFSNNTLVFTAIKSIKKGEEIAVNYNGDPGVTEKVWFDK